MKIASEDFNEGEMIPKRFSCDGDNINPHLIFEEIPSSALSLVLIMNDPDAPSGDFVHWIVWNIDSDVEEILPASVPEGAIEGLTSAGGQKYTGPCPPSESVHHYVFALYALDTMLDLDADAEVEELRSEMEGHIVNEAKLTGLYKRH